ncbi:MAG: Mpo1-like protein [Pirellulales bacterium]
MSESRYQSFAEFWPYYVREHTHPACRALHFIGSTLGLVVLGMMLYTQNWWLLPLGMVIGYGFAWVGHFFIEHNRPATFKYPLWSFIGDWKMWGLMVTGRMRAEVERAHALAAK